MLSLFHFIVCLFISVVHSTSFQSISSTHSHSVNNLLLSTTITNLSFSEYQVLYDIYQSTQGSSWFFQRPYYIFGYPWNFTIDSWSNPCNLTRPWQGVTCSTPCDANNCHIINLQLDNHNLNGTIPSSIGELSALTTIDLDSNLLYGSIPLSLYDLTNLTSIRMSSNRLTGTIPFTIGQLHALQVYSLFTNELTGSIPSTLTNLRQLTILELYLNELTGSLPLDIGVLTNLKYIQLSNNHLTGSFPSSISNLTSLILLEAFANYLSGTIPHDIGNLANTLRSIDLDGNIFYGTIPDSLYSCKKIYYLSLFSNLLYGSISGNIQNMINLMVFDINTNLLTGNIPNELTLMSNLSSIYLFTNEFIGTIPSNLSLLTNINDFYVNVNYLTGNIPVSIGQMTSLHILYLFENYLTGSLPDSLINNTQLQTIYAFSNQLTGSIPAFCSNILQELTEIFLFDNQLTFTIPNSLFQGSNLFRVDLSHNFLIGTISNDILNATSLSYLYVDHNMLSGTISSVLFQSNRLIDLVLSYNSLTGSIDLNHIQTNNEFSILDLGQNILTGSISLTNNMFSLQNLLYLSVMNNQFTNALPSTLLALPSLQYLDVNHNYFMYQLPSNVSTKGILAYLDFSTNYFSGSIPWQSTVISNNSFNLLKYLSVSFNLLTGSLPITLSGTHLEVLYLHNNSLTGSIPSELFASKSLSVFMASFNCFTGTIPETSCQTTQLTQLILDGLHSSTNCIHSVFSLDGALSYVLTNGVHGTIPNCLFNLPNLTALHLSGNNLHGSLPEELTVQSNISSLILANNMLTGTIPSYLINSPHMKYMDLSFNQFKDIANKSNNIPFFVINTNEITSETANNNDSIPTLGMRLEVNHLSGNIPNSWTKYISSSIVMNVLDGNMFACDISRNNLPSNDPNVDSYQCGSDNTNDSLYVAGGMIVLVIILCVLYGSQINIRALHQLCLKIWYLGDDNRTLIHLLQQTQEKNKIQSIDISYETTTNTMKNMYLIPDISKPDIFQNKRQSSLDMLEQGEGKSEARGEDNTVKNLSKFVHPNDLPSDFNPLHKYPYYSSNLQLSFLLETSNTYTLVGRWLVFLIICLFVVLEPIYIGLTTLSGTYTHQYVWILSAAYLSGIVPATILLIIFLLIIISLNYTLIFKHQLTQRNTYASWIPCVHFLSMFFATTSTQDNSDHNSDNHMNNNKNNHNNSFLAVIKLSLFILFDVSIVLLVNVSYVLALNTGYSSSILTLISLSVSLFKLTWGNLYVIGYGRQWFEIYLNYHIQTSIILILSIFNNVIAPYIAEIFASSNCFLYIITNPPSIETVYYKLVCLPIFVCNELYFQDTNSMYTQCGFEFSCSSSNINTYNAQQSYNTINYIPPFHYNYTCSSSLLSAFCYVFVYRYLFTGIIEPLFFYLIKEIQRKGEQGYVNLYINTWSFGYISNVNDWQRLLASFLPLLMKYEEERGFSSASSSFASSSFSVDHMKSPSSTVRKEGEISSKHYRLQELTLTMMFQALETHVSPGERSLVRFITDITVLLSFGVLFPPLGMLIFLSIIKDIIIDQHWVQRLYRNVIISGESVHLDRICQFLYRLDKAYQVWVSLFWTGLWWSALVAVWFWSFSLYDILGSTQGVGPVKAIGIVLLMGLSPYWSLGLFSCGIRMINIYLSHTQPKYPPVVSSSSSSSLSSSSLSVSLSLPSIIAERKESTTSSSQENIMEERLTEMVLTPSQSLSSRIQSAESFVSKEKNIFLNDETTSQEKEQEVEEIINPLQCEEN